MGVTLWLLVALLCVAAVLVALALSLEARPEPQRPVRISLHSLEDRQRQSEPGGHTARLTPPPDLKYGGVTGRPRSYFLNDDGEWIGNPHK